MYFGTQIEFHLFGEKKSQLTNESSLRTKIIFRKRLEITELN